MGHLLTLNVTLAGEPDRAQAGELARQARKISGATA
jgi:hypothetical protein